MMRLVAIWGILTLLIMLFYYFVDRARKIEVRLWTLRYFSVGIIVAIIFGLIIFSERY